MKNNPLRTPSVEKPADYGCHRSHQGAPHLLVSEPRVTPQPYHIRAHRYEKKSDAPYEEKQTYEPGGTHTIPPPGILTKILTPWPPWRKLAY